MSVKTIKLAQANASWWYDFTHGEGEYANDGYYDDLSYDDEDDEEEGYYYDEVY